MADLASMKNIGERTASWLNEAGIYTPERLAEIGAVEAYRKVKRVQPGMSLVGLYALQGAILDIHWNDLSPDMKQALRQAVEDSG